MVTVPVQVLIHVNGLPVYTYGQGSVLFWCYLSVHKWHGTILFCVLYYALDSLVYVVNVM